MKAFLEVCKFPSFSFISSKQIWLYICLIGVHISIRVFKVEVRRSRRVAIGRGVTRSWSWPFADTVDEGAGERALKSFRCPPQRRTGGGSQLEILFLALPKNDDSVYIVKLTIRWCYTYTSSALGRRECGHTNSGASTRVVSPISSSASEPSSSAAVFKRFSSCSLSNNLRLSSPSSEERLLANAAKSLLSLTSSS